MCMQMFLAVSSSPPVNLQQHARDRTGVVRIAATGAVEPNHPTDVEDFADAIEQLVLLLAQRLALLAGRGLIEQLVDGRRAGTLGQLLRQVVGQLDELFVLGDRGTFALEFDHRPDRFVKVGEDPHPAKAGLAAAAQLHGLQALLAQPLDRLAS